MALGKHNKTQSVTRARGMGKSDTATLTSLFATSPIYLGDVSDSTQEDEYNAVLNEVINDAGHTFGTFNPNYGDAPEIASVEGSDAGGPANGFQPNPSSPGEGNGVDPSKMPAPPDGYNTRTGQYGTGVGSNLEPSASSEAQSTRALGGGSMGSYE